MNNFDNEKNKYENISIPESLDLTIRGSLKKGRRKTSSHRIKYSALAVVVGFSMFVITMNVFPSVAYAVSQVPGLNRLVRIVTFDRGFDDSVKGKLVQEINYVETKNGVTLRVSTIVGDYKRMWIGYNLASDDEEVEATEFETDKSGSIGWNSPDEKNSKMRYAQVGFSNPISEFNIEIKAKGRKSGKILATFNVPIKLNDSIKKQKLQEIKINNPVIKTSVGDIKLLSLKTLKSRTIIEFDFISDKYKYYGFNNPTLISRAGKQSISDFYWGRAVNGKYCIEFQGGINSGDRITFEAEGMYYGPKGATEVVVNIREGKTLPNYYNINVGSINNNSLILISKGTDGLSLGDLKDSSGNIIGVSDGTSYSGERGNRFVEVHYKLNKKVDIVKVDIQSIYREKTEGISVDL